MAGRFHGKVIVITGAAGGIGRATALRFAGEGAGVALVDLPGSALEDVAAEVEQAGGTALVAEGDVTRADAWERVAAATQHRFGGVDLLFNNAGIEGAIAPLTAYPDDVFDRVLAVNVRGVWLGMKTVAPRMRARGGGVIVNTASTAGLGGGRGLIAYYASKHAVVGMTKCGALELAADGIRVNAVCPAPIETRMMRSIERGENPEHPEQAREETRSRILLGRYGEPGEVAALVAFLCSDEAAFITGGIYTVDGGYMAARG
jgi:3alpha(or 20beta)-hydroxysteroid dehydrogenase